MSKIVNNDSSQQNTNIYSAFNGRRWADIFSDEDLSLSYAITKSRKSLIQSNHQSLEDSQNLPHAVTTEKQPSIEKQSYNAVYNDPTTSSYRTQFPMGFNSVMCMLSSQRQNHFLNQTTGDISKTTIPETDEEFYTGEIPPKKKSTEEIKPKSTEQTELKSTEQTQQKLTEQTQQKLTEQTQQKLTEVHPVKHQITISELIHCGASWITKKNKLPIKLLPEYVVKNNSHEQKNVQSHRWGSAKSCNFLSDRYSLYQHNFFENSNSFSIKFGRKKYQQQLLQHDTSSSKTLSSTKQLDQQRMKSYNCDVIFLSKDQQKQHPPSKDQTFLFQTFNPTNNNNTPPSNVPLSVGIQAVQPYVTYKNDNVKISQDLKKLLGINTHEKKKKKGKNSVILLNRRQDQPSIHEPSRLCPKQNHSIKKTSVHSNHAHVQTSKSMPVIEHVVAYRERQIAIEKASNKYQHYILSVKKTSRKKSDPMTPLSTMKCSSGEFNNYLREWKRQIREKYSQ